MSYCLKPSSLVEHAVQGKYNEHQGEGEPIAFVRFLFSRLNYTIKGVSECRADKMVSF